MNQPLDELYLPWLYSQEASIWRKQPTRTYWSLFRLLFTKEFVWIVPNDDNRVEDGRDLRLEFIDDEDLSDVDPAWMELGCSFLEMLIGLSRRLSFEADGGGPREWFWVLMGNLQLENFNDASDIPCQEIDQILDGVIWRTYKPNGSGGLFPLTNPKEDQRDVEIWYQLSAYLMEQ